jgi:hypothetical protein
MGNIIDFPDHQNSELKHTTYTEGDGDIGVSTLDQNIEIVRLNDTEFVVITPNGSTVHSRDSLSEFLWLAAVFLDSEKRNYPAVDELVGCDY